MMGKVVLCIIATLGINLSTIPQSLIGTSVRYQSIEPFHAIQYEYQFKNAALFGADGAYGLRTTILQQRPHVGFGFYGGYNFTSERNYKLALILRTGFSGYRLSPITSVYFSEFSMGYSFHYGEKWRILHQGFLGRTIEGAESSTARFSYFTWMFSLGLGYAL